MILAKTYPAGAVDAVGQTQIEVPNTTIAILTAIIAIVPAGMTALTGAFLTTPAQQSSAAIEGSKLGLQSRRESADLLRSAMEVEDADKRSALVRFLYTAKLVDQNESVVGLAAGTIPQWPPSVKAPTTDGRVVAASSPSAPKSLSR